MKKFIALLFLVLAATAPAYAADTGFYLGANAGNTSSDAAGSKNPAALTLQAGYQFHKNIGVEVQYGFFGDIAPIGTRKISGISASAVGTLPFNEQWAGYGKLGMASIDSEVTGTSGLSDGTYNKVALAYGVGGQFNFDQALALRFGLDHYSTGGSHGISIMENGSLVVVSVGVKYKF